MTDRGIPTPKDVAEKAEQTPNQRAKAAIKLFDRALISPAYDSDTFNKLTQDLNSALFDARRGPDNMNGLNGTPSAALEMGIYFRQASAKAHEARDPGFTVINNMLSSPLEHGGTHAITGKISRPNERVNTVREEFDKALISNQVTSESFGKVLAETTRALRGQLLGVLDFDGNVKLELSIYYRQASEKASAAGDQTLALSYATTSEVFESEGRQLIYNNVEHTELNQLMIDDAVRKGTYGVPSSSHGNS